MTDYWKSTGKYFCEICKCWLGNDKPTRDFHEKGKRHNENKKRKIIEVKRDAMQKRQQDAKDDTMFAKMEKAALAAVQKDAAEGMVGRSDIKQMVKAHSDDPKQADTYPWSQMSTPQGFNYYYNSLTGESTWIMPEVFKKIEEQKKKLQPLPSNGKEDSNAGMQSVQTEVSCNSNDIVEERDVHPLLGGWSTVETPCQGYQPVEAVDTSDPYRAQQNKTFSEKEETTEENREEKTEEVVEESRPIGKKFKEKVLQTNLASSTDSPVSFKKRKTGNRNVRKRNEDE